MQEIVYQKLSVIIITLFFLPIVGSSQDITSKTLTWNINQITNGITGDLDEEEMKIITNGKNRVECYYDAGLTQSFEVIEVLGSWSNVSRFGEIVYEVKNIEKQGTISFKRGSDGTVIQMTLINEEEPEIYIFNVTDVK